MKKRKHHSQVVYSRSRAWRELSLKIRNEKKCCEICGSDKHLCVHHILEKKFYPELLLENQNLICLCSSCHFKLHHHRAMEFHSWLAKYKNEQFKWILEYLETHNLL